MGKVYQFPKSKVVTSKKEGFVPKSEEQMQVKHLIDLLVIGYTTRIEEIEQYIKSLKELDGKSLKNPKEVIGFVREVNKLFYKQGMGVPFHTFSTLENQTLIYFNDANRVGIYEGDNEEDMVEYEIGSFIEKFEYYPFNFLIPEVVYEVIQNQIGELETTIKVLQNTKI